MKLYLNPQTGQGAGTQADAKKLGRTIPIDVPVDKAGLLEFLNSNEVGKRAPESPVERVEEVEATVVPLKLAPTPQAYAERSCGGDAWFEGLSLAHQLTLANLALENARNEIGRLKGVAR